MTLATPFKLYDCKILVKKEPAIICLEGLDGSGKRTTAEALVRRLELAGFKVGLESFPMYKKWHSFLVRAYLHGKFGRDPNRISPYIASIFYAFDRFFGYHFDLKKKFEDMDFIIFDRYTTSNMLFQGQKVCTKLRVMDLTGMYLTSKEKSDIYDINSYIKGLEYDLLRLPTPKYTFVINVNPDRVIRNMRNREKLDIHESLDIQLKTYNIIQYVSSLNDWNIIDAMKNDTEMKTTSQIVDMIFNTIF